MAVGRSRGAAPESTLSATSPLDVFRATPMQRVLLLKGGLAARDAQEILGRLAMPRVLACKAINVSRSAMNAKSRCDEALPLAQSERVLGLAKLIGQVQHMAQKSGASDGFNAWTWFSDWVVEPLPALGGTRPFELLDTIEGQSLIAKCLNQIQTGAYA